MTQQNQLPSPQLAAASFMKPVAIGAGIAFMVISLFVFGVDNPKPEWGNFWRIRPLVITPLAGAIGGGFYYFLISRVSKGFSKTLAVSLGLIVYLIGLWLGVVLGLAGTMWD